MTSSQLYRECERLFAQVDWTNPDSVRKYNEAVQALQAQREKEVNSHDDQ